MNRDAADLMAASLFYFYLMGMKYCCLALCSILLAGCLLKGRNVTEKKISYYQNRHDAAGYFLPMKLTGYADSASLQALSFILTTFDERPLADYATTTPVIRFVHCPSFTNYRVIRIDNKECLVKRADQQQNAFNFIDVSSRLTADELKNLQVQETFMKLNRLQQADSAHLVKTYPWLQDEYYHYMLHLKQHIPGADSMAYSLSTIQIKHTEIRELLTRIDDARFWEMPVSAREMGGTDGSEWYLEVIDGKKHHVVHRFYPDTGPFHELGKYLLQQYGHANEHEIY